MHIDHISAFFFLQTNTWFGNIYDPHYQWFDHHYNLLHSLNHRSNAAIHSFQIHSFIDSFILLQCNAYLMLSMWIHIKSDIKNIYIYFFLTETQQAARERCVLHHDRKTPTSTMCSSRSIISLMKCIGHSLYEMVSFTVSACWCWQKLALCLWAFCMNVKNLLTLRFYRYALNGTDCVWILGKRNQNVG